MSSRASGDNHFGALWSSRQCQRPFTRSILSDLSLEQFILQIKNVIVYYFWRPSHGIILGRKVCTKIDGFNPPSRLSSNKQTMGPVVAIVELLHEQSLGQSNGETERVFNNVPDPN
ncbi:unnamed protein product [Citrullus colocynthis]|uniref:Uncharacterized protein n=1 Tax=Citrullus colocynthis TaxID=252529 RepID=A0ABP0Z528_9ROSI